MKTLDEVIKAWSICYSDNSRSDCTGCPYADENGDAACFNHDREDALHYLKEFKRISARLEKIALGNITETLEKLDNPALTWDELKTMEGKPVWIEADNGQEQFKHWFIIDEFTFSDIPGLQIMWCLNNSFRFWEADIGKTWQAYRKEKRS